MAIITDKSGNLVFGITSQVVTLLTAANTAGTLTLPAPGAGLSHYLTFIDVVRLNPTATAVAAAAALLAITTTNLPGSLQWSLANAIAAGAMDRPVSMVFDSPMKASAAATPTTIVLPAAGLGVQFRVNVGFYVDV